MKLLRNVILIIVIALTLGIIQSCPVQADSMKKDFRPDKARETQVSFDDLELTIPAGAADGPMTVERDGNLNLSGYEKPSGFKIIAQAYKFGPHGQKFQQDKPLQGRFKIALASLPLGASLADVKLYYINEDNKKLEAVPEQQVNHETGTLEAKLRHFSDYVVGVTSGWNGDGVNPLYDYVNNGDEHVSIYQPQLSVVSPVITLPGRDGFDLKLARSYSSEVLDIGGTHSDYPFIISSHWYWATTYYDFVNNQLHLNDGTSYNLKELYEPTSGTITYFDDYDLYITYDTGTISFTAVEDKQYYYIKQIIFKDGTHIDIPWDQSYETITDIHGNQIKYNFTKCTYSIRSDDHGGYTTYYHYMLLTSITDSVGRVLQFNYPQASERNGTSYISSPILNSVTLGSKTIMSRSGKNTYNKDTFTDAINRTTTYKYEDDPNKISYQKIKEVDYYNGIRSVYTYTESPSQVLYINSHTLYRPDGTKQVETYKIKKNDFFYVTINDGIRQRIYTLKKGIPTGLTGNETTKDLSGQKVYQSVNTTYYYYTSERFYKPCHATGYYLSGYDVARPHNISTQSMKADGTVGSTSTIEYNYDNWGNTTYYKDPNGTITYMAYANTDNNGSNINLSQINPIYQNAKYQTGFPSKRYDLLLTKATLVNDPIHGTQLRQTHNQYDSQGNLTKESVVYGNTYLDTSYTYDSYGNMLSKTDPNGNTLSFAYDPTYQTYLSRVYKPDNTNIATYPDYDYDLGKPLTVTDPKGNTFRYTYDAIGRMTRETLDNSDPKLGITRNITYNDATNIVNLSFGNNITGNALGWQYGQITYDPLFGKPIRIQRQINNNLTTLKTITYDDAGRVATEADGMGHTTSYVYDALDRVIKTTYPDSTFSTATWDDHTVTKMDANGNKRVETYDILDHLTTLQEYLDANTPYTTSYQYDTASQLIQTTNSKLAATTNTYDNLGRLIETDFPQDGTNPLTAETFTYDNAGNLKTKTNAKGTKTFNYEFFAGYRLQQVIEPDGRTVTNSYDANDNLLTQQTSNGMAYGYTYNARNMVTGLTAQLDSNTFNVGYDYDTFGRMNTITYPNRVGAVSYNYDELDRLQSIPGFVTSCGYDGDSKLLEMVFGNGIANDYLYDQNDRPTNISVGPSGSLLNLNYSYYANGNIKQINSDCYNYDGLNRLTWAGDNSISKTGNGTAWSYDSVGNMTSKESYLSGASQGNIAFGYDLANRLWSMGGKTYTNDAAGARTGKIDSDSWGYVYDGESRLTQVTKNGADLLDNTYDGSGMRVKEVKNEQATYYLYQGNNPLVEYSAGDGKYTYFIYAGTKRIVEEKDGVVKWYHLDHLGSTRLVTDASGAVVASYKFRPFGETEVSLGSFSTEYGFTGKPMDVDSGLSYFGARWYDPETCRFITPDSYTNMPNDERILSGGLFEYGNSVLMNGLFNPQLQNRYSYCGNNPINRIDFDGHFAQAIEEFGQSLEGAGPYGMMAGDAIMGIGFLVALYEAWHSDTDGYTAGHSTPGGRTLSGHAAVRANKRGFTDRIIDNIVNNNAKNREKQIDEKGRVTWKYTDKRGNTVIVNEKGEVVTVYGKGKDGTYTPPPSENKSKDSESDSGGSGSGSGESE